MHERNLTRQSTGEARHEEEARKQQEAVNSMRIILNEFFKESNPNHVPSEYTGDGFCERYKGTNGKIVEARLHYNPDEGGFNLSANFGNISSLQELGEKLKERGANICFIASAAP